ncbi:MAG: ParB/RepB/Spo0J family partition protein [Solobacterium sp.]|jgi:ParB family chromosome partitioning protein|nr:ParB/RepB/Spo0J family partition protein [Solobacterium sp.]MCH4226768.1 ParB/RepB/Spo0J family partition protein [Solobacterium sp.]MCH4281903.1 ParB/RepB/Spo0J family partition protein [Solobacterium sp.]
MTQLIPVDHIVGNPNNPRKDLGDLTDLTVSVRQNGILQNLSVVPIGEHVRNVSTGETDGKTYMVVIGHRRLAAAEAAGLTEVPCEILQMSEADQVATMLTENMQRNNLTKFEETAGIQQALDLGLTESEVASKTGLSKQTISKHKKAMQIGPEIVEQGYANGATLDDFIELAKIKNETERHKLSKSLGTSSFKWNLQNAVQEQEWKPKKEKIIAILKEKFSAKPCNKRWGEGTELKTADNIQLPKSKGKYFYYAGDLNVVYLYNDEQKVVDNQSENDTEEEERRKSRDDAFEQAAKLRIDFYCEYCEQANLKISPAMMREILKKFYDGATSSGLLSQIILGKEDYEDSEIYDAISKKPINNILMAEYFSCIDNSDRICCNWFGNYQKADDDTELYAKLKELGYQISDTEQSMLDGTWELFEK